MVLQNAKEALKAWTRRTFLKTIGSSVPSLALVVDGASTARHQAAGSPIKSSSAKFIPIDLTRYFNASPLDFGPREQTEALSGQPAPHGLVRTPTGNQVLLGVPFLLGPESVQEKVWAVLSTASLHASKSVEIPLGQDAGFICLASFCDWDENETPPPGTDVVEKVGQHLADAFLVYEDGSERAFPIRRRFEVNSPTYSWGHLSYASRPHRQDTPRKLTDPLRQATDWGELQTVVQEGAYAPSPFGALWVCALPNPLGERKLKALRLEAKADDPWVVCGLTLFRGRKSPLLHNRLTLYRITLPDPKAEEEERWKIDIDLGVVARRYALSDFDPEAWLVAPSAGLGERTKPLRNGRYLYAEVTASPDATLILTDMKTGLHYEFDLDRATPGKELEARPQGARVEVLEAIRLGCMGGWWMKLLAVPRRYG